MATVPVLLRGSSFDREDGFLSGSALAWEARLGPGEPFVAVGHGERVTAVFPQPVDPVVIRLTATDGAGATASAERQVTVGPFTGNAPPIVAIEQPDPLASAGPIAAAFAAGGTVRFEAAAFDPDHPVTELDLRWELAALDGPGGDPDPAPPAPNPPPVTGSLTADVALEPPVDTYYRATFRAADPAGAAGSASVEILVLSEPIG